MKTKRFLRYGKWTYLKLNTGNDILDGFNCYNCNDYKYTILFWNEKQNLQYQCQICARRWD